MSDPDVTLNTLHDDLTAGFTDLKGEMRSGFTELRDEMRSGFADLKTTLVAGFRSLPGRELTEEMVRLLRESNRLQEERFTQLDVRIREQHLETQQILHAILENQRLLVEGQRALVDGQRALLDGQRALSSDISRLIARIDALIRGRGNGGEPPG